ncbi:MAG: signal peptide peptidase SppA [Aquificae bacterium]|nr:signal peptide peptidase SppA [Aquificota bacterium]
MKKKIAIGIGILVGLLYLLSYLSFKASPKIAVIQIKGVISEYMPIIDHIQTAQNNKSIKAVVIVVDSPGGAVGASQEIYSAIEKLRKKKPVVVSMGNVAASGGYYISIPANVIYANGGTITGSIGVIIQHINISKVMEKIGVEMENIKSGKNKDILYPNNKLTPEQRKLLETAIKDVHNQFLEDIVKYRPVKMEKLKQYADGRIFTGRQAKEIGLVDKIGNVQDAIKEAKKLAKLEGKPVLIIHLGDKQNFIKKLMDGMAGFNNISIPQFLYLMSF